MKFATVIVVVVVVAVVAVATVFVVKWWTAAAAELTPGEAKIRDLVREVYTGNIVSERVARDGADAVLVIELRDEKLEDLKINLSSLARKHEQEGLSLPAIKMGLRFD